jgi:translocation protein SEC63
MQALLPKQSELYQLPHINASTLKHFTTKKRKIESISSYLALKREDRRALLSSLDDASFSQVELVAQQYPRIELGKAEYIVYGDPVIVPSSLVTLAVKFRCLYGSEQPNEKADNEIPDPQSEKENVKWWEKPATEGRVPHTPHFPSIRKPSFSVILSNASIGRLIGAQTVYGATKDHVARIQFQAPPEVGSWTFQVYIRSDTFYQVADMNFDLKVSLWVVILVDCFGCGRATRGTL